MTQAATDYQAGRVITRPRYTDTFRASCVLMLEAAGYPDKKGALQAVGRSQGVPEPTLLRWFRGENNPAIDIDVSEQRASLTALLEEIAYRHAENAANPDLISDTSARDSAVVMGIAFDKLQVLLKLTPERTALVQEYVAATASVGWDGDDMMRRIIARAHALREAGDASLLPDNSVQS